MSNPDCNCADLTVDQATKRTQDSDGWIEERPVKTAELPEVVADDMSRFFGESIEAFDDMISAIRRVVEGDGIAIDELCHVEGETSHQARTDDETYHFRCFYDGIVLAHVVSEPVEIRTETPTNEPIEIRVSPGNDIDVTPSDAVMSFGVAAENDAPIDDTPTAKDVYGAVCPYVRAFYTREGYERWAEDVAASTVGIPLESGVPIAVALTETAPTEVSE